jgi:hypothetical protein
MNRCETSLFFLPRPAIVSALSSWEQMGGVQVPTGKALLLSFTLLVLPQIKTAFR